MSLAELCLNEQCDGLLTWDDGSTFEHNGNTIDSNDGNDEPISPKSAASHISASPAIDIIVDTHGHAHLAGDINHSKLYMTDESIKLKSITCSVAPGDWKATLEYASNSYWILPALGVHPWYLDSLPENWLDELEILLKQHPSAIVGEIGLSKMARFIRQHPEGKSVALDIQRSVFKNQMILAAKLRRPVSVHCVNQHGVFISVLEELLELASSNDDSPLHSFPVAIGMHSFTGTAHQVKQLLNFETKVQSRGAKKKKKKKQPAPADPLFYFGFSHTVNHVMCTSEKSRKKGREAVRSIPENRLLAESDVHSSHDLCGGTAGAVAYIAWARDASLQEIANVTAKNGLAFLRRAVDLDD